MDAAIDYKPQSSNSKSMSLPISSNDERVCSLNSWVNSVSVKHVKDDQLEDV